MKMRNLGVVVLVLAMIPLLLIGGTVADWQGVPGQGSMYFKDSAGTKTNIIFGKEGVTYLCVTGPVEFAAGSISAASVDGSITNTHAALTTAHGSSGAIVGQTTLDGATNTHAALTTAHGSSGALVGQTTLNTATNTHAALTSAHGASGNLIGATTLNTATDTVAIALSTRIGVVETNTYEKGTANSTFASAAQGIAATNAQGLVAEKANSASPTFSGTITYVLFPKGTNAYTADAEDLPGATAGAVAEWFKFTAQGTNWAIRAFQIK